MTELRQLKSNANCEIKSELIHVKRCAIVTLGEERWRNDLRSVDVGVMQIIKARHPVISFTASC